MLVLAPTRELAVQVHSMITTLAQHTDISAALVVGGLSSQVCMLARVCAYLRSCAVHVRAGAWHAGVRACA